MAGARSLAAALLAVTLAAPGAVAGAQSVQYRSPAGVEYRAQPDTGPVARAARALAAEPRSVERHVALGLAQAGAWQFREAIATFGRGLALAPDDPTLLRWRGHRWLTVRELDRALADLERADGLAATRDAPRAVRYGILYHLGVARHVRGDLAGAAEAFARAQPLAPDAGELAGATDWLWTSLARAGRVAEANAMLARRPDSLATTNAYARRLRLYRGELPPDSVLGAADTAAVQAATLSYGVGSWYLVRGDTARARTWLARAVAARGGWPAFGFIAAEAELARLASRDRVRKAR